MNGHQLCYWRRQKKKKKDETWRLSCEGPQIRAGQANGNADGLSRLDSVSDRCVADERERNVNMQSQVLIMSCLGMPLLNRL